MVLPLGARPDLRPRLVKLLRTTLPHYLTLSLGAQQNHLSLPFEIGFSRLIFIQASMESPKPETSQIVAQLLGLLRNNNASSSDFTLYKLNLVKFEFSLSLSLIESSVLFDSQIEVLYSKLYDKYSKLKNKKCNKLDKLNGDQEEVFVNYVSAAEEYVKYLKNENEMLRSQVDDLRIEVDSIRVSKDEKSTEYHKLWMEESKKNEVLHEEIERLQKLQENGTFSSPKKKCKRQLSMSGELFASSPGRMTRSKCKRSSWIETEGAVTPHATGENDAIQRELIKDTHKDTFYNGRPVNVQRSSNFSVEEDRPFVSACLNINIDAIQDKSTTTMPVFQRQSGNFASSQSDSPTSETPTSASSGSSSFSLSINDAEIGNSFAQWPVGAKKTKLKGKNDEGISTLIDLLKERSRLLAEIFKTNRQTDYQNQTLQAQYEKKKLDVAELREENKILLMDLNFITDMNVREFYRGEQSRIMKKRTQQHD